MDRAKEITTLASDLIRCKTVEGNADEFARCMDYVRDYFTDTDGLFVQDFDFEGLPAMVISNRAGATSFDILMNGHIDVVPAPDNDFLPYEKDGKLFGRGACDMKASLAAMMAVMKHVAPAAAASIGLMVVSDEEVGGFNGTAPLVAQGYRGRVVIIPDDMGNLELTTKEKGLLQLDVTFTGKAAHSCEPWKGESAVDALVAFAAKVRKRFPKPAQEAWATTCNIGTVQGGKARNQLAERAQVSLDIRYIESDDPTALFQDMSALAAQYNGHVRKVLEGAAVNTSLDNPLVQQFSQIATHILGHQVGYAVDHGASDARFFAAVDCPVILFKPPSQGMHAANEAVDLAGLATFYEVLAAFCQKSTPSTE